MFRSYVAPNMSDVVQVYEDVEGRDVLVKRQYVLDLPPFQRICSEIEQAAVCKYVNGTQKCVERKKKPPQKPVPLPTAPPQTNVTQTEAEESQESEEVQATAKPPSRRPPFNLTDNQIHEIPEIFRKRMRLTPTPPPSPGTPLPVPPRVEGPEPPLLTVPVTEGGEGRPDGTHVPGLPSGFTLTPVKEDEGLPGSGFVPELPPSPLMGPQIPSGGVETGLPGQGGVPLLPPPPPLSNSENGDTTLRRTSQSASPSSDADFREQSPLVPPIVASAVTSAPPFDFNAVDGNQQRIL